MIVSIVLLISFYILLVRVLTTSFQRCIPESIDSNQYENVSQWPAVTVLVPFRNEAKNLPRLVSSLSTEIYPGWIEFVFIDDHSTDPIQFTPLDMRMCVLSLPPGRTGKKAALDMGIRKAIGEIVLTIDADAKPGTGWIRSMVEAFVTDPDTRMVTGPVRIEPAGFFGRLQAMEFGTVMAVTAVGAHFGNPLMANGANLAFRRADFLQIGGYQEHEKIRSGDDHFLMLQLHAKWPGSVRFNFSSDAIVATEPQSDVSSFFRQRIRWAEKWRSGLSTSFVAAFTFLVQAATILVIPMAWWTGNPGLVLLLPARWISEYALLRQTAVFPGHPLRLLDFLFLVLVYPWYILITAFGTLGPSPVWKGR